jgi:hypothetical protein
MTADSHDGLLGAEAIYKLVTTIVDPDCRPTPEAVQRWIDREVLPTGRFGRQITASKQEIRAALAGQTPTPPTRTGIARR